jgi:hypothetical protein
MTSWLDWFIVLGGIGGIFAAGRFFVSLYQAYHDWKGTKLQEEQLKEEND